VFNTVVGQDLIRGQHKADAEEEGAFVRRAADEAPISCQDRDCWDAAKELVEPTSNQERKMAFRSDWKSADQLQADIDAGSIPPAHHLIIDLWRRVEELQAHIDELERQMKAKNSN
jgi:hypothetical protein